MNVLDGRFDSTNLAHITTQQADRLANVVVEQNDVLLNITGASVARCCLAPTEVLPARVNQHVAIVRLDRSAAVPGFVQGYLVSPLGKRRLLALAQVGATREALTKATIEGFSIPLPALPVQERIAAILGAIDGLIENSRRRIATLDKMAQGIYREWFVHRRYPGHENDESVGSSVGPIPTGWSIAKLRDVIELRYGKALKASARKGGAVAVVGSSGIVGWHDESLVDGPAIVVGRKGNVGSLTWIHGQSWPIDTTYYVSTAMPLHYVYRMLREIEFIDSHAAVPGLSRDQAYLIEVLRPRTELAALFDQTASKLTAMSAVLESQADVLSIVRDALLPKLVTGAIDVSSIDPDKFLEGLTG